MKTLSILVFAIRIRKSTAEQESIMPVFTGCQASSRHHIRTNHPIGAKCPFLPALRACVLAPSCQSRT